MRERVTSLFKVALYDLLLDLRYVHVPTLFDDDLHWPWHISNLRNVDLYDLFLQFRYVKGPDLFDDLHWPWHVPCCEMRLSQAMHNPPQMSRSMVTAM